jgi:MoxR-like ATPase
MAKQPIELDGTEIRLAEPVDPCALIDGEVIGRERIFDTILTAWTSCRGRVPREAQAPLLIGPSGAGKNTIVYEIARRTGRELYILNGHDDVQPGDLTVAPMPPSEHSPDRVELRASALLTAMCRGGIGFIDEIGKLRSAALAPLAPLLDGRRYLDDNTLLLRHLQAHPEFRLIAATNPEDMWTERYDDYLRGRLRPEIRVGHVNAEQVEEIVEGRFSLDPERDAALLERFWRLWWSHDSDSLPGARVAVEVFATAERIAARERLASAGECHALTFEESVVIEPRHLERSFRDLLPAPGEG